MFHHHGWYRADSERKHEDPVATMIGDYGERPQGLVEQGYQRMLGCQQY